MPHHSLAWPVIMRQPLSRMPSPAAGDLSKEHAEHADTRRISGFRDECPVGGEAEPKEDYVSRSLRSDALVKSRCEDTNIFKRRARTSECSVHAVLADQVDSADPLGLIQQDCLPPGG